MVYTIREQKLVDSSRRALLKYVIISDGGQVANTLLVDVSMLRNSLNANNMLLNTVSNTDMRSTYATTVKRVFGSLRSSTGYIKLTWDGANNDADIVTVGSGIFDFNFEIVGGGAAISNPQATSNGDIYLSTAGLTANDSATLFIELKKNNRDYAAGQFNDPAAFNNYRGPGVA